MLQGESEEVWINTAIYRHALLRMQVIGGQRSVRIALPFLLPHHSGPATMQGLPVFHLCWNAPLMVSSGCAGRLSPIPPVLCHGPALWSPPSGQWVVVSHVYAPLQPISMSSPSGTGIPLFLPSRLQSPSGLPNVDLGGHNCRGYDIRYWITYPEVMYPIELRQHWRLPDASCKPTWCPHLSWPCRVSESR